jgi:TPR repeat protein
MIQIPKVSSSSDPEMRELYNLALKLVANGDRQEATRLLRSSVDRGCIDSMVLLGSIVVNDGEDGKKEALALFKRAAEAGSMVGTRDVGYMFSLGLGCDKDKKLAVEWYRRAAEMGNSMAQCNLGVMYEYGNGVKKDLEEAVRWYRRSAEGGYPRGQTNYAYALINGIGIKKDPAWAVHWLEASSTPRAKRYLAQLYLEGNGVEKSVCKAVGLLRSSAETDAKSMVMLADIYWDLDRNAAIELLNRSAAKGNADAVARLQGAGLPVPEISECRHFRKSSP